MTQFSKLFFILFLKTCIGLYLWDTLCYFLCLFYSVSNFALWLVSFPPFSACTSSFLMFCWNLIWLNDYWSMYACIYFNVLFIPFYSFWLLRKTTFVILTTTSWCDFLELYKNLVSFFSLPNTFFKIASAQFSMLNTQDTKPYPLKPWKCWKLSLLGYKCRLRPMLRPSMGLWPRDPRTHCSNCLASLLSPFHHHHLS